MRLDSASLRRALAIVLPAVTLSAVGDGATVGRAPRARCQALGAVEEEVPVLHERRITIHEDVESGPLNELRFPPGLEALSVGVSETGISTISHSPESTTETLVENSDPDQVAESLAEVSSEKVLAKPETHDSPRIDFVPWEEPGPLRELDCCSRGARRRSRKRTSSLS